MKIKKKVSCSKYKRKKDKTKTIEYSFTSWEERGGPAAVSSSEF